MNRFALIALFWMGMSLNLYAQSEEDNIKTTINNLFIGMKTSDSSLTKTAFAKDCIMQTIISKNGNITVKNEKVESFLNLISSPHPQQYDERITFTKILIDGPLASVWTDYKFYIGDKFSHCGVNSFQLVKGNKGWQIVYLIDTRRKDNCN